MRTLTRFLTVFLEWVLAINIMLIVLIAGLLVLRFPLILVAVSTLILSAFILKRSMVLLKRQRRALNPTL